MSISSGSASLTCIGFILLYVGGFYIFKQPGLRNDPNVIKARMKAVTVASIASALIVWALISQVESEESIQLVLGLQVPLSLRHIGNIVCPLLLTMYLFLGPLSIMLFDQELPFQKHFDFKRDVGGLFTNLVEQRNYIVVKCVCILL